MQHSVQVVLLTTIGARPMATRTAQSDAVSITKQNKVQSTYFAAVVSMCFGHSTLPDNIFS